MLAISLCRLCITELGSSNINQGTLVRL